MDSASLAAMGYYAAEEDKLRRERQEQNNPIDAIGKTALATGAIAAAILGGRRLSRGNKVEPRTGGSGVGIKNTSSTVDLSNINPNTVRRAAGRPAVDIPETVVASRTPPPVVRTEPKSTLERLDDRNEFIRQAREERPQGITLVSQLGEEPTIVPTELILPKTITTETPTAQGFGLDYLNTLLGKTSAPAQSTTLSKTVSQPRALLDPFGSPTVPTVRSQETSTRGTRLLSPAAPDAADRLLNDPYILKRVNAEQEAKELAADNLLSSNRSEQARQQAQARRAITESGDEIISSLRSEVNTAQAAAQGDYAQQYLKTAGYKDADTMVDLQVSNTPRNTDQTLNAIDAAEDQQTGRVYQQLQRNEDLDLNQVEIMEDMQITDEMRRADREAGYEIDSLYSDRDQGFDIGEEDILREANKGVVFKPDTPINQVASQLPDGLPVDQAEGLNTRKNISNTSAARFLEQERDVISRELQNKDLPVAPTRIEKELANRLSGSTASSYGPKYTARKQALELYAQTGDPQFLETVERYGLKPVTFDPDSEEITSLVRSKNIVNMPGVGEVSTASLRKPVITESTARQADEFVKEARQNKTQYIEDFTSEIEGLKQKIYGERKERAAALGPKIASDLAQAKASGQQEQIFELENQLNNLRAVYRNPELGDYREFGEGGIRQLDARLRGAQKTNTQQLQGLEKRYPTTLTNSSGEGSRLFGVVNEEGDFIPETMELRSERRMIDAAPKGGGGRNIAEYASGSRNITLDAIREVQQGGRRTKIRDYDIETGGAPQVFEDDRSGSGRVIDNYGIRLAGEQGADKTLRPSQPRYAEEEILQEAYRTAKADPYDDAPIPPSYKEAVQSLGSQPATEVGRRSILASEAARLGKTIYPSSVAGPYPSNLLTSKPKPLPTLNNTQSLPLKQNTQPSFYRNEDTQLSFPAYLVPATQVAARVRMTPADQAAEQLNAYMSKLQRGRTSPLTSDVRIQPSLF